MTQTDTQRSPKIASPPPDSSPQVPIDGSVASSPWTLHAWGRALQAPGQVVRPEKQAAVLDALDRPPVGSMIPRGGGRSYGDAALNHEESILSSQRLDRFVGFDPEAGTITCEPGVSLGELVDHLIPEGLLLPVLPGTRHVTVGGAIAADVHGKNHVQDGAFANNVRRLRLATPEGRVLVCSRSHNPEVFWATIGGMGLTGTIVTATLDLKRVDTAYLVRERHCTRNLNETIDTLAELASAHRYAMAWIDASSNADPFGRGVVSGARHAVREELDDVNSRPLEPKARLRPTVPFKLPSGSVNPATVAAFNALYYRLQPEREIDQIDVNRFFFPLDALEEWHRVYGSRGMLQFQGLVPRSEAREGIRALLTRVRESPLVPALTVLKAMGPEDRGMLSFPMRGLALSIDVPARKQAPRILRELNQICLEHGGRVYLAKDATLEQDAFEAMYPRVDRFRAIKWGLDPQAKMASDLGRRLGLVEHGDGEPS